MKMITTEGASSPSSSNSTVQESTMEIVPIESTSSRISSNSIREGSTVEIVITESELQLTTSKMLIVNQSKDKIK